MIASGLALLTGSKYGRLAAMALLGLVLVFLIMRALMGAGAARERGKIAAARVVAIKRRIEVDDEIRNMGQADRRREFDRWLRDPPAAG